MTEIPDQKFDNFGQWIENASVWLTAHPNYRTDFRAICFDAKGRLCRIGGEFERARNENAFPIRWLWPDQVAELGAILASAESIKTPTPTPKPDRRSDLYRARLSLESAELTAKILRDLVKDLKS